MPAANRGAAADRRFLHDDEPGALEVLHQALGDDRRHHLAGVVRPLAPAVAQREGERIGEVFRTGGREVGGGHARTIARAREHREARLRPQNSKAALPARPTGVGWEFC